MIKRNLVNNFLKYFLSGIVVLFFAKGALSQTNKTSFREELGISNIYLEDATSLQKVLGKNIWDKHFEANEMFPRIECLNKEKTQILRLFFFYGGAKNNVAEFELLYLPLKYKKPKQIVSTNIVQFKSTNGIQLGMTKQAVIKIIGKNYKTEKKDGFEQITYYTDDTTKGILKKLSGVAYFIKCKFKNGKLWQYNFGFEYP
jgi:hypothetical protein